MSLTIELQSCSVINLQIDLDNEVSCFSVLLCFADGRRDGDPVRLCSIREDETGMGAATIPIPEEKELLRPEAQGAMDAGSREYRDTHGGSRENPSATPQTTSAPGPPR